MSDYPSVYANCNGRQCGNLKAIESLAVRLGEANAKIDGAEQDRQLCICGHALDQHNDNTKRCCFSVTVGLNRGENDTDPIRRICDLCPPSGFTTGFDAGLFGVTWPREDWLADGDREYTRRAMNLQESKIIELTSLLAAANAENAKVQL